MSDDFIQPVLWPDNRLITKCEPVTEAEIQDLYFLPKLVEDMLGTMRGAGGDGIAAPQIGRLKRVCIVMQKSGAELLDADEAPVQVPLVLVNPWITSKSGDMRCVEGCLSFPGYRIETTRREHVTVEYRDLHGETHQVEGSTPYFSLGLQHELDHLDGELMIRFIGGLKRDRMRKEMRALKKSGWKYVNSSPPPDATPAGVGGSPIAKPDMTKPLGEQAAALLRTAAEAKGQR